MNPKYHVQDTSPARSCGGGGEVDYVLQTEKRVIREPAPKDTRHESPPCAVPDSVIADQSVPRVSLQLNQSAAPLRRVAADSDAHLEERCRYRGCGVEFCRNLPTRAEMARLRGRSPTSLTACSTYRVRRFAQRSYRQAHSGPRKTERGKEGEREGGGGR